MKVAGTKQVDPYPVMPVVGNEFEERRVACDFQLVFGQVAQQNFASLKDTYEFVYRKAFIAGKTRRELDVMGSPARYPDYIEIL
jgi:hypothetical protein